MNKFLNLLKKEIKELLTLQLIIPLVIGVGFFVFIGNVVGSETKKSQEAQDIAILDLDNTNASKTLIDTLEKSNFKVNTYSGQTIDTVISDAKSKNISTVVSIPQGFEKSISEFKPQTVETYSLIKNFSITGSMGANSVKGAIDAINEYVSNEFIKKQAPSTNPQDIKQPVKSKDFVIIGDKTANVNPQEITSFIMSQTIFVPIVMFLIIMFAAQMIAVSIASEKENKTLETLLSTPISRTGIVSAKMIAAGLVSLLMAAVYMFGMRYYINGFAGGALDNATSKAASEAVNQLGLALNTQEYILLGISLFLSIMIALAISIILGAFAEDVKKVQGLIAPITFLIMIPYILTMFMDVNSASPAIKYLVYAIPFSHPFMASPNLMLHQSAAVVYGIIYQAVIFLVFVIIAARIFSTDRILTMKLNFNKRRTIKFKR